MIVLRQQLPAPVIPALISVFVTLTDSTHYFPQEQSYTPEEWNDLMVKQPVQNGKNWEQPKPVLP
jgi:hypothetical protein